ncbi:MAG: DUF4136 domain-containing protein [Planctomycetota bacterium]|nr:DUF4136 domain-containing protein [Planctomycetota bacterium]
MKNPLVWATLALVSLPACSSLATNFDYDTTYDFVGLRKYSWVDKQDNSISTKRVRDAVDAELHQRGYEQVTANPDFQVAAYVSSKDRLSVVDWGYSPSPTGYWSHGHDIEVRQYVEGTLVLDIIDPRQNSLVWRASASKAVDRTWTPEERDAEVREAVGVLLAEFPPKKSR